MCVCMCVHLSFVVSLGPLGALEGPLGEAHGVLGGPFEVPWGSLGRPLELSGPGGSVENLGEFLDAVASLAARELPVKNLLQTGPTSNI